MSNEKYDDWFDEAFDEAFDRAASRSSLPTDNESKRQSWQQVQQQIKQVNKKKQRRRRFQLAGVIAASMAFGALIFSPSSVTQAVTPVYQEIKDWGNGVVTQIFGMREPVDEGKALTAPPPEQGIEPEEYVKPAELVDTEYVPFTDTDESLTESQKRAVFKIPKINYLPEDYKFHEATALTKDENADFDELHLQYKNSDDKFFYIDLIGMQLGKMINLNGDIKKTIVLESGAKAYLTENNLRFLYDNDQVVVSISGFFTEEEFIKIANSIQ
ncbi:DUF4367 domain-containing protein [Paenibacillus sp. FSL W8-0187]|uniref:DUF4367 domain-containing protein n=1 Tax=Paenibacillus sp. FSL W8-0187 TaxID=2921710 RepID=UPI0030D9C0F8